MRSSDLSSERMKAAQALKVAKATKELAIAYWHAGEFELRVETDKEYVWWYELYEQLLQVEGGEKE